MTIGDGFRFAIGAILAYDLYLAILFTEKQIEIYIDNRLEEKGSNESKASDAFDTSENL